jgi:hypothetical protein
MGNKIISEQKYKEVNPDVYCYNDNGYLEIKSVDGNKLLEMQLSATNLRSLIGSDLDVVFKYENKTHTQHYTLKKDVPVINSYYIRLNGDIRKIYVDFTKLSKQ